MPKNHWMIFGYTIGFSMLLMGCSTGMTLPFTMMAQGSQPPTILTTTSNQQAFYDALNSLTLPPKSPIPAPEGVAEGVYTGLTQNGEEVTTFIKNGYFDHSLVIYYPNFITKLRTDLVNGLYDGWVTYRLPTSLIKQKVLFQQGDIQEAIVYDDMGKPAYHFWFTNEQPVSGIRYDTAGRAMESMF